MDQREEMTWVSINASEMDRKIQGAGRLGEDFRSAGTSFTRLNTKWNRRILSPGNQAQVIGNFQSLLLVKPDGTGMEGK